MLVNLTRQIRGNKKAGCAGRLLDARIYLVDRLCSNLTNSVISACLAPLGSLAGMGMVPQLPEPPWDTFITRPSIKGYSLPL